MSEDLMTKSDKQYWHRYLPTYRTELSKLKVCNKILEFGVFKGESIRWLNYKYPNAKIFAADILPVQPEWPVAANIEYLYVDQGKIETINNVFAKTGSDIDLLIEDGSHLPEHQKNCLLEGLKHISSGGIFILEDLHTSHPEHAYYKKTSLNYDSGLNKLLFQISNIKIFGRRVFKSLKNKLSGSGIYIGPLHLLLCLEYLKANGKELDEKILNQFSYNSLFTPEEVKTIFQKISEIILYRRTTLPYKCYECGSSNFQFHTLKCECGTDLYSNADSMSAVIHVK